MFKGHSLFFGGIPAAMTCCLLTTDYHQLCRRMFRIFPLCSGGNLQSGLNPQDNSWYHQLPGNSNFICVLFWDWKVTL